MTLSNIFFGKKVVQQAYLNNALIYKSKGWETLPSTCSEVWTKSYDKINGIYSAIVKDNSDNLYVSSKNSVYKIDSEGNLKWKYVIGDTTMTTSIVVFPTYIYCAYIDITGTNLGYVAKIDTNGNLISTVDVHSLVPISASSYFNDMQKDNNNIYAITPTYLLKLNQDLKVIDGIEISSYTGCAATRIAINNGPYIFVGTGNYGFRLDKSNFKNSISLPGAGLGNNFNITTLKMDNIGNLYASSFIYPCAALKYDVETCKLITTLYIAASYDICTDSQENVYFVYLNSNSKLEKYSSDGTLIWDNIQIPALDTSKDTIKIVTDSNNNIYVAYIDSNGMLAIKKFINLVKEN